jgi:predicted  nucleic acid-binding Zn-ribbon protein
MRTCQRCGGEFNISPTLTHCPNCQNSNFTRLEDLLVEEPSEEDEKNAAVETYTDVVTIARLNSDLELTIHEPGSTVRWMSSDVWVPLSEEMA